MNPDRQQANNYLRTPDNLWRWTENGAVLVWRDGSTIAFREEIVQILEWLAPNGLPSFGAIVFLLAACRSKVPNVADIVVEAKTPLPKSMGDDATVLLSVRQQLKAQLESALAQLAKVSQLPSELNTGIKARCILAEAVFEPARAERHIEARAILRGMREPLRDAELTDSEQPGVNGSYIRQIHIVAEGLKHHTAESLQLRLRTGLDALPKEIDADLPTAERARRLIEELSRDNEFGAVARAAQELVAAVRLPRRLGEREQLAIGGVADITNRGPLDRLLLSELAHDDLTLSVRVALNEALYFRREPPMREPPGTLALLLDSGVRLWGVPRVLATAVALALVARDKQHSEVLAWRAQGKQLQPVDLLSRNGLTQHLGALETSAHPGEALATFASAIPPDGQNQTVLITHRDALDDPEFRRALAEHPDAPGFVAVVNREGRFELHAMPFARRPPLCEADLDLALVFDDKKGVPPIKIEVDPSLPSIFGVSPFPFLLPIAGKLDFWVKGHDGFIYAILNDRRLVQFRDNRTGARVLASDLPGGKTLWMDCIDGVVHAVKGAASQRPARLLSLPLQDGQLRLVELVTGEEVEAVHRCGEVILVIRKADVRAYALSDGRLLGRTLNPHRWMNGRFFRGQTHFYFAVWDGQAVKFQPVTIPSTLPVAAVTQIFDRDGSEGPWLLFRLGEVVSTNSEERIKLSYPINTLDFSSAFVSRSGHRLAISSSAQDNRGTPSGRARMFDLTNGRSWEMRKFPPRDFQDSPIAPTWNLFRVVKSVAWLRDGFALCGGRWRKLMLNGRGMIHIADLQAHEREELRSSVSLAAPAKLSNQGVTLQTAEWPCGSKVFLDNRGLLHLKSHDSMVPEISLVLSDGEVAGWTSDGHVCGPKFFFEGEYQSEPKLVFERVLQFLERL
jgi:hypothetical protein